MERFRVESGSVFEFSAEHNAYLFCGKLNGRSLSEFIEDYMSEDCE